MTIYNLLDYEPYKKALTKHDRLLKKIGELRASLAADQERLAKLEAEAAQQLAAGGEVGGEGYAKMMDEVKGCMAGNAAIERELEILKSALELAGKELATKKKEARKQIMIRARADHEKIVGKGIAAVKELLAALAEEEQLINAVQHPLEGTGFLARLAAAFPCRNSNLRCYYEQLKAKGYDIEGGAK